MLYNIHTGLLYQVIYYVNYIHRKTEILDRLPDMLLTTGRQCEPDMGGVL